MSSPGSGMGQGGRIRGTHWRGSSIYSSPSYLTVISGENEHAPLYHSAPFMGVDGAEIAWDLK